MANTGFYTLGSRSGSFVANKRNDDGTLQYQSAENQIGIERQRALQDLNKNYEQTINNAFASYLASQENIANSQMGQGFKQQYLQAKQENTLAQIAAANQSAFTVRQEINTNTDTAQAQIQNAYQTDVANMDRALNLMSDYREYVNMLRNSKGESVYDKEQMGWDIKYLYSDLFNMDPKDYYEDSTETIKGKSYVEWLHENLSDTSEDLNFGNWLYYNQGLQNLGQMIERSKIETPYETRDREKKELVEALSNYGASVIEIKENNYNKDREISIDEINKDLGTELRKLINSGKLKNGQAIKMKGDIYLVRDDKLIKLKKKGLSKTRLV